MAEYNQRTLQLKRRAVERAQEAGQTPQPDAVRDRLPPGQHLTRKFPVLDLGIQPDWDPASWRLTISGQVRNPVCWTWEEYRKLPRAERAADFHCVTRWSKFDVRWSGVSFRTIVEIIEPLPGACYVIQYSADGYSTNVRLDEMLAEDAFLADELEGSPLPPEHGGPLRMIIPGLYAWKGAKFLRSLEFLEQDQPGFWETRGYHNHGDPWREERFSNN